MKTIFENKTDIYKINNSKFIGFSYKISNIDQITDILLKLKKEYHDATHICYAYIIGNNKECQKFYDDNEPSRIAGFPILDLLNKLDVTNCLVVVVRYFGGTKLGISGLLRSYLNCAELVVKNNLVDYKIFKTKTLKFEYSDIKLVDLWIKKEKIVIINKDFNSYIKYEIKVNQKYQFPKNISKFLID